MPTGTHSRAEPPPLIDAETAQQRALLHMLEAIALLDEAKQAHAAAHLQHAIDVLRKKYPQQH